MLLLESDSERRAELTDGLTEAGMSVTAVGQIAEIERWPAGDIVVTDARRFTPWWKLVGAIHVLVLADTPEQGLDACARGASLWMPRTCSPGALVFVLRLLSTGDTPGRSEEVL